MIIDTSNAPCGLGSIPGLRLSEGRLQSIGRARPSAAGASQAPRGLRPLKRRRDSPPPGGLRRRPTVALPPGRGGLTGVPSGTLPRATPARVWGSEPALRRASAAAACGPRVSCSLRVAPGGLRPTPVQRARCGRRRFCLPAASPPRVTGEAAPGTLLYDLRSDETTR